MIHRPLYMLAALLLGAASVQAHPPMPTPGLAGPGGYVPPPASATRSTPARAAAATISAGLEKLFAFVRDSETPQNRLQTAAFLDREIAPYFDFAYMAQFVSGASWPKLTEAQRTELAAQLESRILGGLAQRLIGYGGQEVRFVRPRRAPGGGIDVQVGLGPTGGQKSRQSRGGYPTRLVFRLYERGEDWLVFDVIAEGRSLLAYYRGAFEQLIREQAN